jgi:hypothetical protein
MRLKIYTLPTKEGHEIYLPEESPYPDRVPVALPWLPLIPRVMESMARAFFYAKRSPQPVEIELLTPKIIQDGGLKEKIQGGLLETRFQDEKLLVSSLNKVSQLTLEVDLHSYGFFRWFLGILILALSMGNPVRLALGLYLVFGRPFLASKVKEVHEKQLYAKVLTGIDSSFQLIDKVTQREDVRLKQLEDIIHSCPDRKEAYIKAFHACDRLGLPQIKEFYAKRVPLDENKIEEPVTYFLLESGDKPQINAQFHRVKKSSAIKRKVAPQWDLFDYSISAKELMEIKRYADLEERIKRAAELGGFEEVEVFRTPSGKSLWAYEIGNPQAEERILVKACCHGEEDASPRAILQMMRSFEKEAKYTSEVLNRARLVFIPADDPDGFDMRGRAAVDMRGREEHNPVQRGRRFRDINATWGERTKSPRILALQEYIKGIRPTFAVDLHESIAFEHQLGETGAGLLSIEHLYIPPQLRKEIEAIKTRFELLTDFLTEGVWKIKNPFKQRRVKKLMKQHPHFEVGEAMMTHIRSKGLRAYGGDYQRAFDRPIPAPPQLIFFDEGRCIEGPLLCEPGVRVCSAWLADEFGTLAFTSETFPNPLDERVLQDLAYVEGGILKILRLGKYEK